MKVFRISLTLPAFFTCLLVVFFVCMPVIDGFVIFFPDVLMGKLTAAYRLLMLSTCLIFVLVSCRFTYAVLLPITVVLFCLSMQLLWSLLGKSGFIEAILGCVYIFKVTAFFIYFAAFYSLDDKLFLRVFKISVLVVSIYSFAIVLGLLLDISIFKNYPGSRFGFKGIVYSGNESSGLCMVAALLCLTAWRHQWGKISTKVFYYILFGVSVLACLCTGTKAGLVSGIVACMAFLLVSVTSKKHVAYVLLSLFCGGVYFTLLFDVEIFLNKIQGTISYFNYLHSNYYGESFVSTMLTGRDFIIQESFESIIFPNPYLFLLGGYPISAYQMEMDYIDLFFVLGPVGFLIYCICFFQVIKLAAPTSKVFFSLFLVFLMLYVMQAAVAGHVLYSGVMTPFVAVLLAFFSKQKRLTVGLYMEKPPLIRGLR